jgi:hypothetical protein
MDHFLDHPGDAALFLVALTTAASAGLPARSTPVGPDVAVPLVQGMPRRARACPLVRYAPG